MTLRRSVKSGVRVNLIVLCNIAVAASVLSSTLWLNLLSLPGRVARRLLKGGFTRTTAALSFATLLGLAPMVAVGFGLISHLPFAAGMNAALDKFLFANLLPDKAGLVIAKHLGQFAQRASNVTLVGVIALSITAVMQMLTIEHAFNEIWRVRSPRIWYRRLAMHGIALLLGPVVFGAALGLISYLAGASFGLFEEPLWVRELFFNGLSFAAITALLALLYWRVPNKSVNPHHALIGGFIAALGFLLLQRLFTAYIGNLPTYRVMYGAFAALPIFLSWLYLSWAVILFGAILVAELPLALRKKPAPRAAKFPLPGPQPRPAMPPPSPPPQPQPRPTMPSPQPQPATAPTPVSPPPAVKAPPGALAPSEADRDLLGAFTRNRAPSSLPPR